VSSLSREGVDDWKMASEIFVGVEKKLKRKTLESRESQVQDLSALTKSGSFVP